MIKLPFFPRRAKSAKVSNTTTFIAEIKKARSLKSIQEIINSGKFTAQNPKTIRRNKRALNTRLAALKIKSRVPVSFA